MLGLVRIHHDAFAVLQSPTRPARFKHDSLPAKFINPDLHRGARAQGWIEEDECDGTPCKRLGSIITALKTCRRIEQTFKLCTRPIGGRQKISRHDLTDCSTLASVHPRRDQSLPVSNKAVAAAAARACR